MTSPTPKRLAADYETRTFLIPAYRLASLQGRLDQLSKRAQQLGLPAFTIDVGELTYKKDTGSHRLQQYYPLTVTGGAPKIDGWRFAAKIDHQTNPEPDAQTPYINLVSGFRVDSLVKNDPELFRQLAHCDPDCDHCKTRRNRNTTFIFEHEASGDLLQVGSTCVTDFAGHDDPILLASASQWPTVIDELRGACDEDYDLGAGLSFTGFEPVRVLAAAAAVVRQQGYWKPREQCHHGLGSAGEVDYLLSKPGDYDRVVKPEDFNQANMVLDWLRDDNFDPDGSMYLNNLSVMARTGHVPVAKIGLMASGVAAWERHANMSASATSSPLANIKLGNVGDKLELVATVEKIVPIDNYYGTSHLHLLRDTETNARLTWFNSGAVTLYEGDTYRLKGTVKDHTVRDGLLQTQLTRVSALDQKPLKYLDWGHVRADFDASKFIKQYGKGAPLVDVRDRKGSTALHYLCQHYWVDDANAQSATERRKAIDWLLDHGADIQKVNLRGERPIDDLLYSRDEALVRACLERWPTCVDHLDADRVHANLIRPAEDDTEVRIGQMVLDAKALRPVTMAINATESSRNTADQPGLRQSPLAGGGLIGDDLDDERLEDDPTLRLA